MRSASIGCLKSATSARTPCILRETRTVIAELDTGESTGSDCTERQPIHHRAEHACQWPARSSAQGINGYNGLQFFANDAYSHYHSLQATLSRRWNAGYFQAAYTFSRSTDATSSGNTALNTAFNDESTSTLRADFRTSIARTASRSAIATICRFSMARRDAKAAAADGPSRHHDLSVGLAVLGARAPRAPRFSAAACRPPAGANSPVGASGRLMPAANIDVSRASMAI